MSLSIRSIVTLCSLASSLFFLGCSGSGGDGQMVVGVNFETLETEFWVAGLEAIENELEDKGIEVLTSIADGDANRQLQQVRVLISRKVDGIIMVPKDLRTCLPAIRAANEAGIPIVLFNRPADTGDDLHAVSVVADNRRLTQETVAYLVERARSLGKPRKAMLVIGDLGDNNAVDRRDGFYDALKGNEDIVELVSEVPSEWTQEKARAGVSNALQANPEIDFIFTSSDFLFPSIVAALKASDRYYPAGDERHVLLGGFDGDATAYRMLEAGYLDATGVQDVYFEADRAVQAILDMQAGKEVPDMILDPGFVIHRDNLEELSDRMWGAQVSKK